MSSSIKPSGEDKSSKPVPQPRLLYSNSHQKEIPHGTEDSVAGAHLEPEEITWDMILLSTVHSQYSQRQRRVSAPASVKLPAGDAPRAQPCSTL